MRAPRGRALADDLLSCYLASYPYSLCFGTKEQIYCRAIEYEETPTGTHYKGGPSESPTTITSSSKHLLATDVHLFCELENCAAEGKTIQSSALRRIGQQG